MKVLIFSQWSALCVRLFKHAEFEFGIFKGPRKKYKVNLEKWCVLIVLQQNKEAFWD